MRNFKTLSFILVIGIIFIFQANILLADDLQARRKAYISKLIEKDVIQKIEVPAQYPHVWVRPNFYYLNFDQKQQIIGVICAYYMGIDSRRDMVLLFDSITNKKIGYLSKQYGLKLK